MYAHFFMYFVNFNHSLKKNIFVNFNLVSVKNSVKIVFIEINYYVEKSAVESCFFAFLNVMKKINLDTSYPKIKCQN